MEETLIARAFGTVYKDENGNTRLDANMSSIFTALIKEAGTKCKRFASDILIDYDSFNRKAPEALLNEDTISFWYGFREDGVDHKAFIDARGIDSPEYLSVYFLRCTIDTDYEEWNVPGKKMYVLFELRKIR